MRQPRETQAGKIQILYPYSSALQRVERRLEFLRRDLGGDPRKVIPVAALARKFDISTRLLWKWIADGLLGAVRGKPKENEFRMKRGIPKKSALQFLKHLEDAAGVERDALAEWGEDRRFLPRDRFRPEVISRAGRPDTARRKIRAACRRGLDGQGKNPREFGEAAGVSRSAVWRAIEAGVLAAWHPTPHRTLIGRRPKKSKKTGRRGN